MPIAPAEGSRLPNPMASHGPSSIARAYQVSSRVVSIAMAMFIPGFLGYWADSALGTTPILLLIGFVFGFAYGLWRLANYGKPRPGEAEEP